jgi:hypothetical protein
MKFNRRNIKCAEFSQATVSLFQGELCSFDCRIFAAGTPLRSQSHTIRNRVVRHGRNIRAEEVQIGRKY